MQQGIFTISLDFELFWGVKDHRSLEDYAANILGARKAIPAMLDLFKTHDVHATWATVGFLFYDQKKILLAELPAMKPSYNNSILSSYEGIENIGEDEASDPFHFGLSLIKRISTYPFQEIATHTFSHYYCLEQGQTADQFKADLVKAIAVAAKEGINIRSLVFPRNQFNAEYLTICREAGIIAYRGNESSYMYAPRSRSAENMLRRIVRMIDTYINISGANIYTDKDMKISGDTLYNIPSSRFLRPYHPDLSAFEGLRLLRIKKDMYEAARYKKLYHLWWHPHNFGTHTEKNIIFLKQILEYYQVLHQQFGMQSLTMSEVADKISDNGK